MSIDSKIKAQSTFLSIREFLALERSRSIDAETVLRHRIDDTNGVVRVLDLGCGDGGSAEWMSSEHEDIEWYGIDVPDSPEAGVPTSDDNPRALFNGVDIPFADRTFEIVYCKQVLEHVRYPDRLLTEVHRVLKRGGTFIGSVSYLEPYHSFSVFNFTPYGLVSVLRTAGLSIDAILPGNDVSRKVGRQLLAGTWLARILSRNYLYALIDVLGWIFRLDNQSINMFINQYFKSLYRYTMDRAYQTAYEQITADLDQDSVILDCGAHHGQMYEKLNKLASLSSEQYHGIEWDADSVAHAQSKGFNVIRGDLNTKLPFADERYTCVFGLSLLEHLLYPCQFMSEAYRVLRPGGSLVLLTPNISTYFTAALILLGKMPSSGPHPDSERLVRSSELFRLGKENTDHDIESDTPVHRHLIVFSYRTLKEYLQLTGFQQVRGQGFGVYPFPKFTQPMLERIDRFHSHQMVFVAKK